MSAAKSLCHISLVLPDIKSAGMWGVGEGGEVTTDETGDGPGDGEGKDEGVMSGSTGSGFIGADGESIAGRWVFGF